MILFRLKIYFGFGSYGADTNRGRLSPYWGDQEQLIIGKKATIGGFTAVPDIVAIKGRRYVLGTRGSVLNGTAVVEKGNGGGMVAPSYTHERDRWHCWGATTLLLSAF